MGQRVVVSDFQAYPRRIFFSHAAEEPFVFALPSSQHHQRQILLHHFGRHLGDQVETFLIRETRDDANQRTLQMLGLVGRQFEILQQIFLTGFFAFQILRRIVLGDERIVLRIPHGVIHSVQNPHQVPRPLANHAIKRAAVFRRLNFERVATAHGRKIIGKKDAALQEIHVAVEFQPVVSEKRFRQAGGFQHRAWKHALIGQIVNGQHHRQVARDRVFAVLRAHQQRNQRRLPIVAMNHIRQPDALHEFDGGAAIFGEALGVVRIIDAFLAIELLAIEVAAVDHEKIAHAAN